jgi:ribonuclease PH
VLDLDYAEDSTAAQMPIRMTGSGGLVELQCTAEGAPSAKPNLPNWLRLARKGT